MLKSIFPEVPHKSSGVDFARGQDRGTDCPMVTMAATNTHGNNAMTSDRPEKLPEKLDTVTLTRALKMNA